MLRRIMLSGITAGAILAVSVWALPRSPVVAQETKPSGQEKKSANDPKSSGDQRVARGSATAPVQSPPSAQRHEGWGDPIVIPAARLRLIDLEDVPSQRDGVLMFIGTEIKDGQQVPSYETIQVQIGEEKKRFRRLKEGDAVQSDELLALVDDTLARADVDIKAAKLNSAHAEFKSAEKTRDEAWTRYETAKKLFGTGRGSSLNAISKEDLSGALLTYNRYVEEAVSKGQAIKVAEQELIQAKKTVTMYEIRPKVSGIVKSINKHRGEAIKSLEPLMQVQKYDRLRVDATLDEQYANRLDKGMEVFIEPIFRESPRQTFTGHRGDITCVAVSKDPKKPYIVSCSDDRTVQVWELSSGEGPAREHVLLKKPGHDAQFKAVACTPRGASANLCLAGDAQGNGYLWDLDNLSAAPTELKGRHVRSITCVAFSPDGKTCATGGQDMQIMVWNTADGSPRFTIPGHRDPVQALYFAPGERLISVSRHPTVSICIWELSGDHYKEAKNGIIQRVGREFLVHNLGVSPDGKHMMDEHFAEMRVVTVPDAEKGVPRTEAILRSVKKFVNFALFSPDGQLALTTPEREGILQLWRIHFKQGRSYEVRRFVSPVNAVPTSAAFAPDGSFVVAAVKDRIYLWPMPTKDEAGPIPATVTNIEKPLDLSRIDVKITAELDNPGQRLRPGDEVTVVAYPQKK